MNNKKAIRLLLFVFTICLLTVGMTGCRSNKNNKTKSQDVSTESIENAHADGLIKALRAEGFFSQSKRNQKVTAMHVMVDQDGWDFEEVEQKGDKISVFSCIYYTKNLAYQYRLSYRTDGLMELENLQILYMSSTTGETISKVKIK